VPQKSTKVEKGSPKKYMDLLEEIDRLSI